MKILRPSLSHEKTRSVLLAIAVACASQAPSADGQRLEAPGGPVQAATQGSGDSGIAALQGLQRTGQAQDLSNQVASISIIVDSGREGWDDALSYPSDPEGDAGEPSQIDWQTIAMAHDCETLYVRYRLHAGPAFDPDGYRYNLYVDVDRNPATGFRGRGRALSIGADALIQGGRERVSTFRFQGGTDQEAWGWSPTSVYPVSDTPLADGGRDIEYAVRLADLNVLDTRATGFDWVAWADYPTAVSDVYPDGGNLGDSGFFNTYTLNYRSLSAGFSNPERGPYRSTQTQSSLYTPLDAATLQCYRQNEGISLIHRYFYLDSFVDSDICPQSQSQCPFLDLMQADFDTIRQAGLKAVVRFAYSAIGPTPPYGDASKERVLAHIRQLTPVLTDNSDVIAVMQAGFIGLWGEWWYSDHFAPDGDWTDRADVLSAILGALPSTRMVQVRAPRYKQSIFGDLSPVDIGTAHSGSALARTGHHNDCFVSSLSDGGTYSSPANEYTYLEEETKWVPMGGETCDYRFLSDPDPERLSCATALDELSTLHWSLLNLDWYKPTLRGWLDSDCLPEIEQRLGYRLVYVQGTFDEETKPGAKLKVGLQIRNEGFAAPFNPRAVELILRRTDGWKYAFQLPEDPRFWLAGETHTTTNEIAIPADFPPGNYELLLNLPDPEPALRQRPEYSIRLANENVWEPDTGYNRLNRTLVVQPPPYYPNAVAITVGSHNWGNLASFRAEDDDTYDIKSSRVAGGNVTDWYASTYISVPRSSLANLMLTYRGQYSQRSVTQDLYIYNFSNSRWDRMDSRAVGNRDDVTVQVTPATPQAYVSPTGESRVRVRGFKGDGGPFYCWANNLAWVARQQ